MIVIGIDPGKAVGTALYSVDSNTLLGQEIPFDNFGDWLNQTLANLKAEPDILIACERFTIGADTIRGKQADAHWAIEVIGVTRYLARCYTRVIEFQLVSPVKAFSPDTRLREIGWYITGKGHANDAVRHVVYVMSNILKIYPPWVDGIETHAKQMGKPTVANPTDWLLDFDKRRKIALGLRTD